MVVKDAGRSSSMKYTFKSHPTWYRGRLFSSRLEARWAAFFDLYCWQWDYEPFDLVGWTPDFRLHGVLLAEVKPWESSDPEWLTVIKKIRKAVPMGEKVLLLNDPLHSRMITNGSGSLIGEAWFGIDMVDEFAALWVDAGNLVKYQPEEDL
jgi:hypothetical protein